MNENTRWDNANLEEKVQFAEKLIESTLKQYEGATALCFTGGKDSTALLWMVKNVCDRTGLTMPPCVYIDEGDVFDEIEDAVAKLTTLWKLPIIRIGNEDILSRNPEVGEPLPVVDLSPENQSELASIDFDEDYFRFEPESFEGSHLIKIVPLREYIEENGIKALFVALRWDEHEARSEETFESFRENPDHLRVHPILPITERELWTLTLEKDIPFCELYRQGYRSLGSRYNTNPVFAGVPAWEQDLENTSERMGRGQNKEDIMEQLRSLGYM